MARITLELLRRRAEHNDGCLSTLKQIALHQQDLQKIQIIGDSCRMLQIVYLCNNYISKIEGLKHLKWLKYVNLAVNNITYIQGLEGCQSLERLDLTLNFIADLTCVTKLQANALLSQLHLTGNPCTHGTGYRSYVIHQLPHLKQLDGKQIVRSERILARQDQSDVTQIVSEQVAKVQQQQRIKKEMLSCGLDPFPAKYNEKGERLYGHSPQQRLAMLRQQEIRQEEQNREKATPVPGSISAIHQQLNKKPKRLTPQEEFAKYGRYLLKNEGKISYHIDTDSSTDVITVTVQPGKFIATSLIDVQVDVNCIRVYIKGKLLQLPIDTQLSPSNVNVQRSTTTGQLKITIPYAMTSKDNQYSP